MWLNLRCSHHSSDAGGLLQERVRLHVGPGPGGGRSHLAAGVTQPEPAGQLQQLRQRDAAPVELQLDPGGRLRQHRVSGQTDVRSHHRCSSHCTELGHCSSCLSASAASDGELMATTGWVGWDTD